MPCRLVSPLVGVSVSSQASNGHLHAEDDLCTHLVGILTAPINGVSVTCAGRGLGLCTGRRRRATYKVRRLRICTFSIAVLILASPVQLLTMPSLVEFKPHARDDDAASDAGSDKEPADVTTALIGSTGPALGAPEVRPRFWWSRVKAADSDATATQVTTAAS